ncbi:MAG: MFS transporter [Nitrososphaerota archaeon]|nr:MFS transporter [Nitrososphaerota archaeon]
MGTESRRESEGSDYKNVFALGFVSFFTDISTEMVLSLLPNFIVNLPGSNEAILGLIEGFAEAVSYGLRAFSGVFSDRFRRRKAIVLLGYTISNIVKPLFYIVQTASEAFAIRVADRVGKAVRTAPRDALISESISEKHRGTAFGLHRTLDQAGAIIGPLIALGCILFLGLSQRDVFLLSFLPGIVAVLILLIGVKERVAASTRKLSLLRDIGTAVKGNFLFLLIIVAIFSLGSFNYSFVLIYAEESGIPIYMVPLFYTIINIAHTIIAIPIGVLSDRIGKEKALLIGYGAFLSAAGLMAAGPHFLFSPILVSAAFGLYAGIVETVQRAMVPEYVDRELIGTAYGVYYLVVGIAMLFANTIFGSLWLQFGSRSAALYSISFALFAMIGIMIFMLRKK